MDIEGTYTLQASPEEVWHCMMDQHALRQAIPGIENLERLGEYKHSLSVHINHAPLFGSYQGQITITDQHYPYYFAIAFVGEGRQSTINGTGVVHLNGRGENTVIAYKGTLNIGKPATLLPPPMFKGTARLLLEQFFTALADHLRTTRPSSVLMDVPEHITAMPVIAQPTRLQTFVHRLRLGRGNPALEEQWVNRVRRMGFISGLLLLVWIGTRLPRRFGL